MNTTLSRLVVAFCILLTFVNSLIAKEWNGIVPLKSTRADVERLLGHSDNDVYYYEGQAISIEYAKFPCGHKNPPGWPEAPPGWNVPPDTVVAIRVSLTNKQVPISLLSYDLTKFKKEPGDNDLQGHFYYTNRKEGMAIDVFEPGRNDIKMVIAFIYTPTSNEEKQSRCKE